MAARLLERDGALSWSGSRPGISWTPKTAPTREPVGLPGGRLHAGLAADRRPRL